MFLSLYVLSKCCRYFEKDGLKKSQTSGQCIEIESCQFTNIDIVDTENLVYY